MSDEALLRLRAARMRMEAAHLELAAACVGARVAVDSVALAVAAGDRREFEGHPDVQEAVAVMRGFYGS